MYGAPSGLLMYGVPSGLLMYGAPSVLLMYGAPSGLLMYGAPFRATGCKQCCAGRLLEVELLKNGRLFGDIGKTS